MDDLLNFDGLPVEQQAPAVSQRQQGPSTEQHRPFVPSVDQQCASATPTSFSLEQQLGNIIQEQKRMWIALEQMRKDLEAMKDRIPAKRNRATPRWDGELTQDGRFVCPQCGESFSKLGGVRTHQKTCV